MRELAEVLAKPKGAEFRRCDLHVHTPASADMHAQWRDATAGDLVEHARSRSLDVIGITDHNSIEWCDSVREAAAGTGLIVLPGIELSTREGHLLAIFDAGKSSAEIRELLIRIGIGEQDFGNLGKITDRDILETAEAVEKEGGLSVAAHADRERGFLQMVKTGARRREIQASPFIRAFELGDGSLRLKYENSETSGRGRSIACLQGSDSWPVGGDMHQLDAVGTRYCFLKLDDVSVWALRQATFDPGLRVRLADDPRPAPELVIEGLWLSGGFLGGQRLRFSDEITCLIGDTGSGKSLTVELIRFSLDQQVESILPKIRDEVTRLLGFALNEMDTIFLLLRKGDQRYVVERPWLEREPAPPVVYRVADGELQELQGPIHLPTFFQIKGYSQSEIIEYAREPLARLSLIDSLIDTDPEREAIAQVKSDLRSNASELLRLQEEVARAKKQLEGLPTLSEEIERLSGFLQHPEVKQREAWQAEQRAYELVAEGLTRVRAAARSDFPGAGVVFLADEDLPEPLNADLLERLQDLATAAATFVEQAGRDFDEGLARVEQDLTSLKQEWDRRFEEADRRYRALVAQLEDTVHGQAAVLERVSRLREQEEGLKRVQRTLDGQVIPRLNELQQRRDGLLTNLQTARKTLTDKRRKKADQLAKALDGKVSIEIGHADDSREFKRKLLELRTGSHLQESEIDSIANAMEIHPVPFVKSLLARDFHGQAAKAGIPAASLQRFFENIESKEWLDEFYELQIVDLEDIVRVRFAVDENTYKDLEALAHGQKCTVVLMISLAEGDFPLLVDQPEDALHAPWIESYIVSTLRNRRGTRQCIFATRSANVLVSSDAEQVLALRADSSLHRGGVAVLSLGIAALGLWLVGRALGTSEAVPEPKEVTGPVRPAGNGLIAFHGANGPGISVVQPDGSGLTDLTAPPRRYYDTFPVWSPDGFRLAFLREVGGGPRSLVTADPDGSNQVTLAGDWDVEPAAWSPDGRRIVPGYRGQEASLLVVDVADGTVTPLGIEGGSPSWSPDGRRLAFGALSDIFTVRADGTDRKSLTGKGFDMAPTWSPDGEWVAFLRDRGGDTELYVVRPDGTGARRLTDFSSRQLGGYSPVWSPDGSRIAVEVLEGGEWNIYVVDAATGSTNLMTDSPGDDISPTWSPDGRWIAYAASPQAFSEGDNAFSFDIRILRPDGTKPQTIVEDAGAGAGLSWQPISEPEAAALASQQHAPAEGLPEGQLYLRTDGGAGVLQVGDNQFASVSTGGRAYDVSADGRVLVAEEDALISMDPAGRRTVLFEAEPADELQALAQWSPDGMSAAFSIGAQDPASRSTLCVVEVPAGEPRCFPGAGRVYTFDWAPDGRAIVLAGAPSEPVRTVDPATGAITEVVAQQGESSVNGALEEARFGEAMQLVGPTWSPSGRYLAALANLEASRYSYVPVVLTRGGDVVALGEPSTEFPEPLAWSPHADLLAYTWGAGPYNLRDLRLLDPATDQDRLLLSLDSGDPSVTSDEPTPTITDVAWAPSGRWLAVPTWEGTERLLIIDVEGGEPPWRIKGSWDTWGPTLGWIG